MSRSARRLSSGLPVLVPQLTLGESAGSRERNSRYVTFEVKSAAALLWAWTIIPHWSGAPGCGGAATFVRLTTVQSRPARCGGVALSVRSYHQEVSCPSWRSRSQTPAPLMACDVLTEDWS